MRRFDIREGFSIAILEKVIVDKKVFLLEVKKIISSQPKITNAIVSSVDFFTKDEELELRTMVELTIVSHKLQLPYTNNYATPKTLGVDRIALVCGAAIQFSNKNVLIIDAGTCITYDFLNDKNEYLGGAISPGIRIRYKSLHDYTSKLPFLQSKEPKNFIGDNTIESINSGVVNGVVQEIDGIINQYRKKYIDLTVVLTGGDTNFLSKQLKSSIFANQNFLLEGLNGILIFNKEK